MADKNSGFNMMPVLVGYIQNNCLYLEPIRTFKDDKTKHIIATGIPTQLYSTNKPINGKILVLENIDRIC